MSHATVQQIYVRPAARLPCVPREATIARVDAGLDGDHAGGGRREVTLLDLDAWQAACAELGTELSPSIRRANVVLAGLNLAESRGRQIEVGAALIEILGETRPCELLDSAHPGLHAALRSNWRGGAHGRVLRDGAIAVGDRARWIESTS